MQENQKGYCKWIIRGNKYIPVEQAEEVDKIKPGLYSIKYSDKIGYYLFNEDYLSDEILDLPSDDIQNILKEVDSFWKKYSVYQEYNILHKRGILLHGKQGTGKSSIINRLIDQLINELGGVVFTIKSVRDLDYYATFIPEYFKKIEPNRPIITIIEDIEGLVRYEDAETTLVNILDGMEQMENIIYVATTNNPERLKAKILNRPSRFDIRIEIKPPTAKVREFYFNKKLTASDLKKYDIKDWVEKSEGFSMAHLKEMFISIIILGHSIDDTVAKLKEFNEIIPTSVSYDRTEKPIGFGIGSSRIYRDYSNSRIGLINEDDISVDTTISESPEIIDNGFTDED